MSTGIEDAGFPLSRNQGHPMGTSRSRFYTKCKVGVRASDRPDMKRPESAPSLNDLLNGISLGCGLVMDRDVNAAINILDR